MRPAAAKDRIIAALDVSTVEDAADLCRQLTGRVGLAKVGLELFVSAGAAAVRAAQDAGLPVFLDLKLHDIPNTVEHAARAAARLGIRLLTVHASGGPEMIAAARRGAHAGAPQDPPAILAVTVLTSMDEEALYATGVPAKPADQVLRLARLAVAAGADGLVCSAHESATLRAALGPSPLLVVPGIRPAGGATHDQRRVATPASAVAAGADYLVIGRPLREAASPGEAAEALAREIAGG